MPREARRLGPGGRRGMPALRGACGGGADST